MKLSKLPVLRTAIKAVRFIVLRIRTYPSDHKALRQLSNHPTSHAKNFIQALNEFKKPLPAHEARLIQIIEAERKRRLKNHAPLCDGKLGQAGLYDTNATISSTCSVSKPPVQCLLMYKLIRIWQPKLVIELGTNVGISSAFQAAALSVNGQQGRLITLEASPYRIHLAKKLHQMVGLDNVTYVQGLFADTLSKTLADLDPIDFAFIDGHHQYQPTLDYFQTIYDQAQPSALFVFDDIRWSDGMKKAWAEIREDQKVSLAVDLDSMGICVGATATDTQRYATPPIVSPLASIL